MRCIRRKLPSLLLTVLACTFAGGCNSIFNSWLDPSQVGSFTRHATLEIRTSLSIQDSPIGIPGATDPQPEDLIPVYDDYRYRVGDAVTIRIFELLASNTETAVQGVIDEMGTVTIPILGQVRVVGMTRNEIADELRRMVVDRGYVRDPTVIVEPALRRGQTFLLFGATPAPNLYPIPTPDSRLLEMLNIAGGLIDSVTDIYVIRKGSASAEAIGARNKARKARMDGMMASNTGWTLAGGFGGGGGARSRSSGNQPAPEEKPATTTDSESELREAVRLPTTQPQAESGATPSAPSTTAALEESAPVAPRENDLMVPQPTAQTRWIFVNGEWVESSEPAGATASPPAERATSPAPLGMTPAPAAPKPAEELDWTRLAGDEETRIIHISAQALRDGDPRQNIVVRGGDTIRLMAGQVGEYYIMGQVYRPGAYSLTGRQITLKMAVAAAGNLAPLAWPDRCTIYRRYGDREEMHQVNLDAIFAGKEPDVLLKNNDLVLVGTHPIAPFLAVARSAFRLTYGFGFVYDRNFADIDQYGPKINPDNFQAQPGSRFPNIFR